jgi:hypothetical protein
MSKFSVERVKQEEMPRLTTLASIGASRAMHTPVITKMAGMILITIRASFHWTANATMKPEKKSEMPWMQVYSFSAMP